MARTQWWRVLRGLVTGVLTVAVLGVLVEALCVVFHDRIFSASLYAFDEGAGYRAKPHARWGDGQVTNRLGWNDVDHPLARTPGVSRLLLVGDSYSWAGGLEGNYSTLLSDELTRRGRSAEVLNLGYAGSHLGEQAVWLERDGLPFEPDLVVLAFYVGNDFADAAPWRRVYPLAGRLRSYDTRRVRLWLAGRPFLARSHVWTALRQAWRQATLGFPSDGSAPAKVPREMYLSVERDSIRLSDPAHMESLSENVTFVTQKLEEIQRLLRGRGVPLMVVALPDPYQVDSALREEVVRAHGLDVRGFVWDLPQRVLGEICRERGIAFFDLLPGFLRARADGVESLYLSDEPHWDRAGNELAAQLLAPRVDEALP